MAKGTKVCRKDLIKNECRIIAVYVQHSTSLCHIFYHTEEEGKNIFIFLMGDMDFLILQRLLKTSLGEQSQNICISDTGFITGAVTFPSTA